MLTTLEPRDGKGRGNCSASFGDQQGFEWQSTPLFEMWRSLNKENRSDTAMRKVGLLDPGGDFRDWFICWLDLLGECEQARGRLIDDDIKVAVLLKRVPKKLRDHLVRSLQMWEVSSR